MLTAVKNGIIAALIFVVDMSTLIQDTGQQIDWVTSGVARYHAGSFTVTNTVAVVAADVTVTVAALANALSAGSVIDFGAGDKVVLTADAAKGATSISINPAQSAIAINTVGYAILEGYRNRGYRIPAGTVLARNTSTKQMFPRAVRPGSEAAECVLLTDAYSDSKTDSVTGYGVSYGGIMYENMMPDFTNASWATFKTELGIRFVWKTYRDSRGL